jgi:hypothetical protein
MSANRRKIITGSALFLASAWFAVDFLGTSGEPDAPVERIVTQTIETTSPGRGDHPGDRQSAGKRMASVNPLATISLDSLSQTIDRPLFNASRIPKPKPEVQVAEAPAEEETGPQDITLVGIVVANNHQTALLRWNKTNEVLRLKAGESSAGWLLAEIQPTSVVIENQEQRIPLRLFENFSQPAVAQGSSPAEPANPEASQMELSQAPAGGDDEE